MRREYQLERPLVLFAAAWFRRLAGEESDRPAARGATRFRRHGAATLSRSLAIRE